MMHLARFWILCFMAALLAASGILLYGAKQWGQTAKAFKNMLPAEVDMRLDNLTVSEIGAENRTMTINADNAQYYKSQDLFLLDRVRAQINTAQGRYDVEADSGHYQQGDRVVILKGSIRVSDSDGGVLTCETLTMEFDRNLLTSDDPFCYSTPTSDLEGTSFVFNTREKTLRVDGRTHVLF